MGPAGGGGGAAAAARRGRHGRAPAARWSRPRATARTTSASTTRARGWLFTGDLFLAERLRYLREDEDLEQTIASLRTAVALPLERVFCAHRGPLRDGPAALRRRLDPPDDGAGPGPRADGPGAPRRRDRPARGGPRGPADLDQPRAILGAQLREIAEALALRQSIDKAAVGPRGRDSLRAAREQGGTPWTQ